MPTYLSRLRMRRTLFAVALRFGLASLIFACGFIAFEAGVEVSDRPRMSGQGTGAHIYYTLGLFVLGGLDLGVPIDGPGWAMALMWFAFFAAPAVTGLAVIEGVLRAVGTDWWKIRRMRGHFVVAGSGRLAMLYLTRLRELQPLASIILVDEPGGKDASAAREILRLSVVEGDINDDLLLKGVRVAQAKRVVLLTGRDLCNLDVAAKVQRMAPAKPDRTLVHVSDIALKRMVKQTSLAKFCQVFNTHHIAASHLVRTELAEWFDITEEKDIVVLAGFGRFGQTVLDELQNRARGAFGQVVIVDVAAESHAGFFREQVGFADDYQLDIFNEDVSKPGIWDEIEERIPLSELKPAFVLGCGDENVNLRTAMYVRKRYPHGRVVARRFDASPFAEEIAADGGFSMIAMEQLLLDSMPPAWFGLRHGERTSQRT